MNETYASVFLVSPINSISIELHSPVHLQALIFVLTHASALKECLTNAPSSEMEM